MNSNGFFNRDKLKQIGFKRRYKEIEVEGMGTVRLRNLNAAEESRLTYSGVSIKGTTISPDPEAARLYTLHRANMCIVDRAGELIFEPEDDWLFEHLTSAEFEKIDDAIEFHLAGDPKPAKK